MVFKTRRELNGEIDPAINSKGRPPVDSTKKLTRREIKEKEFLSLARKIRPHVAASIAAAVEIMKKDDATDTNKLKAAAFLLTEYQKLIKETYSMEDADEDTDLTELLGVKKWEKPEVSTSLGDSLSDFPRTLTPKTDEPRVQNEPKEFQELKGKSYVGSAKLDGTSTTVIFDPSTKELIFASRNLSLAPGSALERFLEETGTLDLIKNFDEGVLVLQSEFYGEGIQSNRVGIRGKRMATFNIVVDGIRQSLLNSIRIAGKLNLELPDILRLGVTQDEDRELRDLLKTVNKGRSDKKPGKVSRLEGGPLPIKVAANSGVAFDFTVDELVSDVFGEKYPTTGRPLEGIVYRPIAEVDNFNPVSFKVINNKFLIKYDE